MTDSTGLHRTLQRQLRRLGLSTRQPPDEAQWQQLISVVNASYDGSDADRYLLERSIEISSQEMRDLHDGLARQARQDELTGLPNRLALNEIIDNALSTRQDAEVAIMFVDLDDFKVVNDSLGHSAGDELLVQVARRIGDAVAGGDVVARLGGDEFVVVCMHLDGVESAMAIARMITHRLDPPLRAGLRDVAITASIGIALAGPNHVTTDGILRRADLAMYEAKSRPGVRYLLFDDEMRSRADNRHAHTSALRDALANDELVVYYQPILDITNHRVLGSEALVRWRSPHHGLLLPESFIPAAEAEQSDLIAQIDGWVLRTACQQAAAWADGTPIAVNVAARSLERPDIVDTTMVALRHAGLPPHQLTLEITETTLVSDDASAAAAVSALGERGVRFAIDDFGAGYSSFTRLRRLPAHMLKIDHSLTSTVDKEGDSSTAIVAAIVAMGHALGLSVVAEGVERRGQAERLGQLGCDGAQGRLYAPPRPGAAARLLHAPADLMLATLPPPGGNE